MSRHGTRDYTRGAARNNGGRIEKFVSTSYIPVPVSGKEMRSPEQWTDLRKKNGQKRTDAHTHKKLASSIWKDVFSK